MQFLAFFSGIHVKNAAIRRQLTKLYIEFEVINTLINSAIGNTLPFAFLAMGTDVVIGLFLFLRHFKVLLEIVNIVAAIVGLFCLGTLLNILWACCNTVRAIEQSKMLLQTLRSAQDPYFRALARREQLELLKRAKAMKDFHVALGHFGKFGLDFVVAMWDEIVSQLLFLLSC